MTWHLEGKLKNGLPYLNWFKGAPMTEAGQKEAKDALLGALKLTPKVVDELEPGSLRMVWKGERVDIPAET